MMPTKTVTIYEIQTKQQVAEYPISIGYLNSYPTDEEFRNMAWDNAVDDGVVDRTSRAQYGIHVGD